MLIRKKERNPNELSSIGPAKSKAAYKLAQERYAAFDVDVAAALETLKICANQPALLAGR